MHFELNCMPIVPKNQERTNLSKKLRQFRHVLNAFSKALEV